MAKENLTDEERRAQGMKVRREVLSNEHVDRANANKSEFTSEFQDFITRTAWGDIWSRPGLDRRSRSVAVLSAMLALRHHAEFQMHVLAALRIGSSVEGSQEVSILAWLCYGVPVAREASKGVEAALRDGGVGE